MWFINSTSISPSFDYKPDRCTRYCEEHGCRHKLEKQGTGKELRNNIIGRLYLWNIRVLGAVPGMNYKEANIMVYFITYPLLIVFLMYRLLK